MIQKLHDHSIQFEEDLLLQIVVIKAKMIGVFGILRFATETIELSLGQIKLESHDSS
jgi:hypothetical protein